MSLGELFVELGTIGDTKQLEKFVAKVREANVEIEKQIKANDKLKQSGSRYQQVLQNFKKFQDGFKSASFKGKGLGGIFNTLSQGLKAFSTSGMVAVGVAGLVVGAFVGLGVAFVKAYQHVDKLTESLIRDNQQWVNLIHQTDLAFDKLQGYSGVAGLFDKTLGMNGAAGSIQQLNDRLFELRLTGQGAKGFQMAGISGTGDAIEVLDQLSVRVKQLKSDTASSWMLKQLGLDPRILPMLKMERGEFEKLRKTIVDYSLTADQRLQIQQYNVQLEIARHKWQYIKDKIVLALLPHFVRLTRNITFLVDGLAKFVKFIHNGWKYMHDMNTALGKTVFFFEKIQGLFGALSFLNPFKWLYELIDDVEHYFNGGGSVIGVLMFQLEKLQNSFNMNFEMPSWLQKLSDAADKLFSLFGNGKNSVPDANTNQTNPALTSLQPTVGNVPLINPLNPLNMAKWMMQQVADNRTINQTNNIYTSETGETVNNQFRYAMGSMPNIA